MTDESQGVRSALQKLDQGVFNTEKALVALASLIMTATVSLDIIQRAFARPESKLGEKLLALCALFGTDDSASNQALFADYVSPFILSLVTIFAGWAAYGAFRRQRGLESSKRGGLIAGGLGLIVTYGLVQVILTCPSRWVCFGLLVAGALAWCRGSMSLLGARRVGVIMGLAVTAALLPALTGIGLLGALSFLVLFGWCVHTDVRLWSPVLAVTIVWAGWYGCAQLPTDIVTGGMQLGYVWSQELALILLAWVAFIGASMATRAGRHIQVDALSKILPARVRP
ncbi:MAG: TRAP transporter small permease subunit, partial [Myxococcota bacterium]|nr:TRAP transporter small permease subunit [Myxococcota bacterium]